MIGRFSMIAGGSRDWIAALSAIDSGKRPLPQRELNNLLDTVALAIDAEREARALAIDRLTGRSSLRRPKP
jgi:hypothetical protein